MKSTTYLAPSLSVTCWLGSLILASNSFAQPTFTEQGASILGGVDYEARSASLADIDEDGDLDLFFQGGFGAQQLFRNDVDGDGKRTFVNISSTLPPGLGVSWSAAWGDYDGDGKIDVFVGQTNFGASGDVLKNNGAAGFSNTSTATGLNDPGFHQNVAWIDIDNDLDLDLLIGMEGPEKHEIYLQGPSNSFTKAGAAAGFQAPFGTKAYGMAIGDTDGDGDMDVYISTCRADNNIRNNFFENRLAETGTLSFVDIADSNGTQFTTNSYGAEFHDFDDDGRLDLFMTGADGEPSKIWRNDGGNMFTDVDTLTGHPLLSDPGSDFNGSRAVDYDNDGDLDLFFHDHLAAGGKNYARKLYRNDGGWQFTDVTTAEGLHSTNRGAYDSTWGDIDRDGDQDLIAPTASDFAEQVFLSNAAANGNHWLYITLEGLSDNSTGIGASIYATLNGGTLNDGTPRTLRREANTNAGTFNQSDLPVHFGLGLASQIDELRIRWPDGTMQFLHDVAADQYLTIRAPGDFDGDRDVDAGDLAQWKGDFGLNGDSDSDGDGDSDGADFLAWQRRRQSAGAIVPATTAVPESAHSLVLMMAAAGIWLRRRSGDFSSVCASTPPEDNSQRTGQEQQHGRSRFRNFVGDR